MAITVKGNVMGRFAQTLITTATTLALLAGLTVAQEEQVSMVQPNLHDGGNRWIITSFNTAGELAKQGLCFLLDEGDETTVRGYWYSDTFLGWNGSYMQEGSQVRTHGDYRRNRGHDVITWSLSSEDVSEGEWVQWRENGHFGESTGFAQITMERVGECELPIPLPERPWDGNKLRKFLRELHKDQIHIQQLPLHEREDDPMLNTLIDVEDEAYGNAAPNDSQQSIAERARRKEARKEKARKEKARQEREEREKRERRRQARGRR